MLDMRGQFGYLNFQAHSRAELPAFAGSSPLQDADYTPGNNSATMDFSSFNSLTLASIRFRLNSLIGNP